MNNTMVQGNSYTPLILPQSESREKPQNLTLIYYISVRKSNKDFFNLLGRRSKTIKKRQLVDELEEQTQIKLVQSRGEGKLPVPLRGCQSNQKKNKGVNAGPPNNKTSTLLNTREVKKGGKNENG